MLDDLIAFKLAKLSSGFSGATAQIYSARFGIGMLEWRIVITLRHHQPMTASEIAAKISADKGNVSRSVAVLLERDLIARQEDDGVRRNAPLRLTPRGRRLFEQINPIAREREARLLSVLSAAERTQFAALLDRLIEQLAVVNQPEAR